MREKSRDTRKMKVVDERRGQGVRLGMEKRKKRVNGVSRYEFAIVSNRSDLGHSTRGGIILSTRRLSVISRCQRAPTLTGWMHIVFL